MSRDLSFIGVTLCFGRRVVLQDVTLGCPAGTVTCLVGPNGAGKSTLLALAAGLLAPSSGRITLGAQDLRPFSPLDAVAYLPQASSFPDLLTAGEVLDLALAARGASAAARQEVLKVTGVEAILDRHVHVLSGGWVRRLGLAFTLVPPSDVLLLDEPFVGLDPETLDRLLAYLRERVTAGGTVVLASHEFEINDLLGPRMAVFSEGKLLGAFPTNSGDSRTLYRELLVDSLGR